MVVLCFQQCDNYSATSKNVNPLRLHDKCGRCGNTSAREEELAVLFERVIRRVQAPAAVLDVKQAGIGGLSSTIFTTGSSVHLSKTRFFGNAQARSLKQPTTFVLSNGRTLSGVTRRAGVPVTLRCGAPGHFR